MKAILNSPDKLTDEATKNRLVSILWPAGIGKHITLGVDIYDDGTRHSRTASIFQTVSVGSLSCGCYRPTPTRLCLVVVFIVEFTTVGVLESNPDIQYIIKEIHDKLIHVFPLDKEVE